MDEFNGLLEIYQLFNSTDLQLKLHYVKSTGMLKAYNEESLEPINYLKSQSQNNSIFNCYDYHRKTECVVNGTPQALQTRLNNILILMIMRHNQIPNVWIPDQCYMSKKQILYLYKDVTICDLYDLLHKSQKKLYFTLGENHWQSYSQASLKKNLPLLLKYVIVSTNGTILLASFEGAKVLLNDSIRIVDKQFIPDQMQEVVKKGNFVSRESLREIDYFKYKEICSGVLEFLSPEPGGMKQWFKTQISSIFLIDDLNSFLNVLESHSTCERLDMVEFHKKQNQLNKKKHSYDFSDDILIRLDQKRKEMNQRLLLEDLEQLKKEFGLDEMYLLGLYQRSIQYGIAFFNQGQFIKSLDFLELAYSLSQMDNLINGGNERYLTLLEFIIRNYNKLYQKRTHYMVNQVQVKCKEYLKDYKNNLISQSSEDLWLRFIILEAISLNLLDLDPFVVMDKKNQLYEALLNWQNPGGQILKMYKKNIIQLLSQEQILHINRKLKVTFNSKNYGFTDWSKQIILRNNNTKNHTNVRQRAQDDQRFQDEIQNNNSIILRNQNPSNIAKNQGNIYRDQFTNTNLQSTLDALQWSPEEQIKYLLSQESIITCKSGQFEEFYQIARGGQKEIFSGFNYKTKSICIISKLIKDHYKEILFWIIAKDREIPNVWCSGQFYYIEKSQRLLIEQEPAICDLKQLLEFKEQANEWLQESEIIYILNSILEAIIAMHKQYIYHGDIEESNILISKSGIPKLSDFGGIIYHPPPGKTEKTDKTKEKKIKEIATKGFLITDALQKKLNEGGLDDEDLRKHDLYCFQRLARILLFSKKIFPRFHNSEVLIDRISKFDSKENINLFRKDEMCNKLEISNFKKANPVFQNFFKQDLLDEKQNVINIMLSKKRFGNGKFEHPEYELNRTYLESNPKAFSSFKACLMKSLQIK